MPSVIAATAASLIVGMFDGARNTYTPLQATAATGYISIYAIPIAILAGLLARSIVSAWRAEGVATRFVEETGGAPKLAAWFAYALFALWFFAGVALNALRLLIYRTPAKQVVVLGTAIAVTVAAAGLVVFSKPVVGVLERLLGRIDRYIHARWSRSPFTPRYVFIAGATAMCLMLFGAWFVSLRVRLADLDLSFYVYIGALFGLSLAFQAAWLSLPRLHSARSWVVGSVSSVLVAASLGCIGTGYYVRHKRPYAMLEVWGNTVLAGPAVDRLFNVQLLRRDLRLPGLRPKQRKGAKHPNVVLITIDNARADRMGLYLGGVRMKTMRQLRREGMVFDWAFAAGTVTRRSLPTIVLGVSPNRVRGRVTGQALRLDPRHVLLAERFRAAGYDTAGFLGSKLLFSSKHNLGLIRGLDHVVVPDDANEQRGDWLVRQTRAWLRERRARKPKKPLFLWVHFHALASWDATYARRAFGSMLLPRYDRAYDDIDEWLAFLLLDVWNVRTKHNTLLAIVGDHGVNLDEEKQTWRSGPFSTGRIRVPFYIAGAGRKGKRIARPVGTVDLAPTLLDLAGFEPPGMPHMDGVSLAGVVGGREGTRLQDGEAYTVIVKDASVPHSKRALMLGPYKLIEHDSGKPDELYKFRVDPRQQRNLVSKEPKLLRQLKKRMGEWRDADRVPPF